MFKTALLAGVCTVSVSALDLDNEMEAPKTLGGYGYGGYGA